MYKIIGTDQKEYGPISADQIRQWISEGRINAQTMVQAGDDTDWKPLGDFPEFAQAPKPLTPLPITPPTTQRAKTSGLAVASLVFGILGALTCGVTALVGLILGLVSMGKIKKSGGQLEGKGLALAGTIVSAVFLLMLPLLAAMLLPALAKAKQRAQTIVCVNNMKQLALGVRIYSGDNKDQFPPAATWCDAIQNTVDSEKPFKCPGGDANQKCHYAFNAKLAGMDVAKAAPDTVLLFETSGGWNVSGGPELMPNPSRHGRMFIVALADGSVQQINESRLKTLRWDP
jgi:hypothetical protein